MKILYLVFLFLQLAYAISAQQVISSAGETKQITGYEISWTLGEPMIETFTSGSAILTQGFHQSKLIVTAINEPGVLLTDLQVYPNPTSDFVTIRFDSETAEKQYSLLDMTGKRIYIHQFTEMETKVDMSSLSSGTYLLQVGTKKTNLIQSFKIIKK